MSECMNPRCHLMREHDSADCGWPAEQETPMTTPLTTPETPTFARLAQHCTDEGLSPDSELGGQAMQSFKEGFRAALSDPSPPASRSETPREALSELEHLMANLEGRYSGLGLSGDVVWRSLRAGIRAVLAHGEAQKEPKEPR